MEALSEKGKVNCQAIQFPQAIYGWHCAAKAEGFYIKKEGKRQKKTRVRLGFLS